MHDHVTTFDWIMKENKGFQCFLMKYRNQTVLRFSAKGSLSADAYYHYYAKVVVQIHNNGKFYTNYGDRLFDWQAPLKSYRIPGGRRAVPFNLSVVAVIEPSRLIFPVGTIGFDLDKKPVFTMPKSPLNAGYAALITTTVLTIIFSLLITFGFAYMFVRLCI
uniref:Uncharacterized protein n=1 Tax=Panagrolaimus sp. JU765 TaxID=591449 RepID=A0AC34Q1K5_9BILA